MLQNKILYTLIYCCIYIFFATNNTPLLAQTAACPEIKFTNNSPINLHCVPDTCITLKARLPNIRQTSNTANGYIVNTVPFTEAQPFSIPNANTIFVNQDDRYSGVITLPFTFCFFGSNYNSVIIGANGSITFNTNLANTPSSYNQCAFNTPYTLPRNDANHPNNAIFPLLHDIDPSSSTSQNKRIEWSITGEAPCRKMIINWFEIPQFSCTNLFSTFQCVLYENTNVIDVFVKEKPICTRWNCGIATIGIQNSNSSIAITPPNRNATNFDINTNNSEGWRFLPNGASLLVNNNVSLYDENYNLLQQVSPAVIANGMLEANFTTPICFNTNNSTRKYYVKADYIPCSGDSLTVIDSIIVDFIKNTNPPIVNSPIYLCQSSTASPLTAIGSNLLWYTTPTGGTASNTAPTPNTSNIGTQTYYVSQTVNNCESERVPINVNIATDVYDTLYQSICAGDSFIFNGNVYKTAISGIKDTFTINGGCDSIVTLVLAIIDTSTQTVNINLCENELPYNWNGIVVNSFGNRVARYVTNNQNGCDSITYLNLISLPTQTITEYDTICNNQLPFIWNNISVSQGGNSVARAVFSNQNGCDSVRILNLIVNDTIVTMMSDTICSNLLPFRWNNQTIQTVGAHTLSYSSTAQNGCDSISILNLTVNDSIVTTVNVSICESELPFTWNGNNITQGGNSVARYVSNAANGCDSISILNLIIKPTDTVFVDLTICESQLPYTWNGHNFNTVGSFTASDVSIGNNGCDSTTILRINIDSTIYTSAHINICENQLPYTWNNILLNNGGQNIATYQTTAQNGCDSIITLNLTVTDTIIVTETLYQCSNQMPFVWNNINITTAGVGVARYTTTAQNGCDSTTLLNVIVNQISNVTISDTICSNAFPYVWNGFTINNAGNNIAQYTTSNQFNCDSTTILNLYIKDTLTSTTNVTICETQLPYLWNGQTITQAGNPANSYTTVNRFGCDSTAYLNLTINPVIYDTITLQLCENQLPYIWNGNIINNSSNRTLTYHTSSAITSCDSIITAHVVVSDTQIVHTDTLLCAEYYPFRWHNLTINDSGTYRINFKNVNNCDSTIILHAKKRAKATMVNTAVFEGCGTVFVNNHTYSKDTSWIDTIKSIAGCDSIYHPYRIKVHQNYLDTLNVRICIGASYDYNGKTYYASTTETNTFTSQNGCDSIEVFNLIVEDLPILDIKLLNTKKLCVGDTIIMEAFGAQHYTWTVNEQQYHDNPIKFITYQPETIVQLKGKTNYGCENQISYTIVSELCCEIGIPNAFSPNNDGLNDAFQPIIPGNPEKYEMHIFDRWGNLIFTTIKKNDSWDGTIKGKFADPGVYFYYIIMTCMDGSTVTKKGDITLIR